VPPVLRIPRDAGQITVQFGHVDLKRTTRSYRHLPWVYLFSQAIHSKSNLSVSKLAPFYNKEEAALYKEAARKGSGFCLKIVEELSLRKQRTKSRNILRRTASYQATAISEPLARFLLVSAFTEGEINYLNHGLTENHMQVLRDADQSPYDDLGICFLKATSESPRVFRRPFCLSQAAKPDSLGCS